LDQRFNSAELWWAQRAKTNWLQLGDKNTKFFHIKVTQRKRKNHIKFIQDEDGNTWHDSDKITDTFIQYFSSIFDTYNPVNMLDSVNLVQGRIDPQMCIYLAKEFIVDEVTTAVKHLKSSAAPSPDGLPAMFYQSFWDTIGHDIIYLVLSILNSNIDPGNINYTFICLIPKLNNPQLPSDFRLIALCNVILKIVTKTISNRIKNILPNIISSQQSAFLPGRLISYNTLLAYEAFHYLKSKK